MKAETPSRKRCPLLEEGLLLGAHLSISGGVDRALDRAKELKANSLQIFSQNVRSWSTRELKKEELISFREKYRDFGILFSVIHTSYLLNLASPKEELWDKSRRGLLEEVTRADALGIPFINTHVGAHTGSGREKGLDRVRKALNWISERQEFRSAEVKVLLENTAGSGTTLGSSLRELTHILEGLEYPDRFGICFDTCHGFAAGYDLSKRQGVGELLEAFKEGPGLKKLNLIHLNDSKGELGSRKDRHEHIGKGEIGESGFRAFLSDSQITNIPLILETPKEKIDDEEADVVNLRKVRRLANAAGGTY